MSLSYVNYNDLYHDVMAMMPQLVKLDLHGVIGSPRSGMVPATIVATELGLPLAAATPGPLHFQSGARLKRTRTGKNFLLIDDSVHGGGSIIRSQQLLIKSGMAEQKIRRACVYVSPHSTGKVHVYSKVMPGPRIFQWNLFGCEATANACFDMDGVLCLDPPVFDDDGPGYQNAIRNAPPKHLPMQVGHIVTNRLERWRDITEDWLARHGVKFKSLHMQKYDTAADRRAVKGSNVHFKAGIYQKSRAPFFVESHDAIAKAIFRWSRRPVISMESLRIWQ